jgi:hypothetical protein
MAMKRVDGKWMMEVTRSDGSTDWVWMNSPEEKSRQERYHADQAQFRADNLWNNKRDYSSGWSGLFGGEMSHYDYTPSFGAGPNQSWRSALRERLRLREGGNLGGTSGYELRTSTADRGYQERMYARNNAIEEMYRQGYSMDQISDHVTGKTNINSVEPDWKDYYAARNNAGTVDAGGLLSGEGGEPIKFWGDQYFKGGPAQDTRNPFDMGSFGGNAPNPFAPQAPVDQEAPKRNDKFLGGDVKFNQPTLGGDVKFNQPTLGGTAPPSVPTSIPIAPDPIPSSKPEGGFMGAYNARREELANKRSVMSLFDEMKNYEQS